MRDFDVRDSFVQPKGPADIQGYKKGKSDGNTTENSVLDLLPKSAFRLKIKQQIVPSIGDDDILQNRILGGKRVRSEQK